LKRAENQAMRSVRGVKSSRANYFREALHDAVFSILKNARSVATMFKELITHWCQKKLSQNNNTGRIKPGCEVKRGD